MQIMRWCSLHPWYGRRTSMSKMMRYHKASSSYIDYGRAPCHYSSGHDGRKELAMPATHAGGMDDIVAAETAITWIDGTKGELRYRGYPIGELAEHCTFEQVAYLLWNGDLPSADEARALSEEIRSIRAERASLVDLVSEIPTGAHPL